MALDVETPVKTRFYQKGPFDQFGLSRYQPDSNVLRQNPAFKGFMEKCLGGFSQATADSRRQRVGLINNGGDPVYPLANGVKDGFKNQAMDIMASYVSDFFPNPAGTPDLSGGWANITEIAPRVIGALIDPRVVPLIDQGQALNLVAAGLHIARFPNTQIVIRTGYGGSDSPFTNSRFPGYSEPAFQIAENVSRVYRERLEHKLGSAARRKARETGSEDLTAEEIAAVWDRFNIAKNPVKVELFSAHHTAKSVNKGMNPDKIDVRAIDNERVLREHSQRYHPNIPVDFLSDTPTQQLSPTQKFVQRYLALLLDRTTDTKTKEALAVAEKLGGNRGGHIGRAKFLEYTSGHSQLYGDRLNLPAATFLTEQSNPRILYTIGCRTERVFRTIRDYCSRAANPEGYEVFLRESISQTDNPQDLTEAQIALGDLKTWIKEVSQKRSGYSWAHPEELDPADHNIHELFGITQVGSIVPYYPASFIEEDDTQVVIDQPYGTDIQTQRDNLATMLRERRSLLSYGAMQAFDTGYAAYDNRQANDREAERQSLITGIIADLDMLLELQKIQKNGVEAGNC